MSRKMLASVRGMQLSARGGKIYWVVGTASFMIWSPWDSFLWRNSNWS